METMISTEGAVTSGLGLASHRGFDSASAKYQPLRSDLKVAEALMRAQEKFMPVLKDTDNPFFKSKYATLDGVIAAVRPALREQGLVILQKNIRRDNEVGILTRLIHVESGEETTSELFAPPEKLNSQGIGSVLTYLRRYEYLTITGAAPEDDDANAGSGNTRPQSEQTVQRRAQTRPAPSRVAAHTPAVAFPAPPEKDNAAPVPTPTLDSPTKAVIPLFQTGSADINAVPSKAEYDAYIAKALALATELEKSGLKTVRGLPARTKFGKYVRKVSRSESLELITVGQWDIIFSEFEKLMSTPDGAKQAVGLVEAANVKESA